MQTSFRMRDVLGEGLSVDIKPHEQPLWTQQHLPPALTLSVVAVHRWVHS